MKTKIALTLALLIAQSNAHARNLIYFFNRPQTTASASPALFQIDQKTRLSIQDVSEIIAAWNPMTNESEIEKILTKRVQFMGAKDGLIKPAIVLMDTAILAKRKDVAALLIPPVFRVAPLTGKKLIDSLNLPSADAMRLQDDPALQSLRQNSIALIRQTYGNTDRNSLLMPDLVQDLHRSDATGIANALFGPGSYIHNRPAYGQDDGSTDSRSPIMGMTMDDVRACYARCSGPAIHAAGVGGRSGKIVGAVAGGVIGGILGGGASGGIGTALGILGGVSGGQAVGELGGTAVGAALGWGQCASKECAGGSDENGTSASSGTVTTSGGSTSPNSPSPAPEPSSTDDGDNSPHSDPPTTEDDGGTTATDSCHPGDQSCADEGMAIADDDRNGGGGASDTGHIHIPRNDILIPRAPFFERPDVQSVINPRRDPMGLTRGTK